MSSTKNATVTKDATRSTLVPKLRFPDFEGEWEVRFGSELFSQISERNPGTDLPVLAITQEHGAIPRSMIDYHVSVTEGSLDTYKLVREGDFIISLRSFQGGIEYSQYQGVCSPAYVILRRSCQGIDDYYRQYLKTGRFISILTRNLEGLRDGKMISYKQFSELPLPVPTLPEQQHIADCLSSLDELIGAQTRKVDALKTHKKGLMQQLFPREGETQPRLRFPEYEGEWEERRLGECGELLSALTGKAGADFDVGSARFITYMNVFANTFADASAVRQVNVGDDEKQNKVARGDVFFTISSETPEEVGMSSVLLADIENCYLNSFCALFRFHTIGRPNSLFTGYLLRQPTVRNYFAKKAQGSTRFNLSKDAFRLLPLFIPTLPEQQRIADCLSSLDEQITTESNKLETYKTHKKGLMQKLFPTFSEN